MSDSIDRVESNRIERWRKGLLFCGIGTLAMSALQIIVLNHKVQGTGIDWALDRIFFVGVGLASLSMYRKLSSSTGQFIEWKSDIVIYKVKGNEVPLIIEKGNIKEVAVNINVIEIKEMNGHVSKLDISDFTDYSTRTKIKNNFESISINISHIEN